jgi:PAS domain S-box-containing protein
LTSRVRELFGDFLLEDREGARIEIALYAVSLLASALLLADTLASEQILVTGAVCVFGASAACSWLLSRRGHEIAPRVLLTGAALAVTSFSAFMGNGIHDISVVFYPVIVIFAGLLLGKWATVSVAALCSASAAALVYGEKRGWVMSDFGAITGYFDALTVTITMAMCAGMLWLVMDSLGRSLRTLRTSQLDLAESNRRLAGQADKLRASEARWRSLVENAPGRIMNLSRDGTIASVNRSFADGDTAATGGSVYQLIPEAQRQTMSAALQRVFDAGEPVTCELRGPGEDRWYSLRLGPIEKGGSIDAATLIMTDITEHKRGEAERRQLEEQLCTAQKMEALGQLAGGIAHDFNNLLTVISGNTSLLESQMLEGPARESLDEIRSAEESAASLTRQLLAFGRRQVLQPRVIDLNASISAVGSMLKRLIGEHVKLDFAPAEGGARVEADPGQMEQVLLNLVLNARDSMPEGGKLEVRTWCHESGTPIEVGGAKIDAGRYTVLSVSDDGCGMDEETKARIFEPFFTTKPQGKGTGLGLSSVYGIVKQSGGQISVESEPHRGTKISVYLPLVEEPIDSGCARMDSETGVGGFERILVVEDDKAMRQLLWRSLTRRGYSVHLARDGEEALRIAASCQEKIDLLLTDLVMPGMSGRAFADRFQQIHGSAPVLYMSGYADDTLGAHRILDGSVNFIQKPFTTRELARKLRQALET